MFGNESIAGKVIRVLYWDIGLEILVWASALIYLAVFNPYLQSDFTICPFSRLGFHHCPGCGLGRAVSFLLHGDLQRSLQTHILGIPATVILVYRMFSLSNQAFRKKLLQ